MKQVKEKMFIAIMENDWELCRDMIFKAAEIIALDEPGYMPLREAVLIARAHVFQPMADKIGYRNIRTM
jgi:hypothetical protein